jgi:hypothetical protein
MGWATLGAIFSQTHLVALRTDALLLLSAILLGITDFEKSF